METMEWDSGKIGLIRAVVGEVQRAMGDGIGHAELMAYGGYVMGCVEAEGPEQTEGALRAEIEKRLRSLYKEGAMAMEGARLWEAQQARSERLELVGGRILVVDDSETARRQIRYFLEGDGFEVYEARSGEEAVWLMEEVAPDLILMDIMMTGMDGIRTCERIKREPRNQDIPVIFLTAKGERAEAVRGFNCGGVDYIVKPFHPAESLTRIRTHLRIRRLIEARHLHIRQLEAANRTKDRLLRVASQDLGEPVAAIAGLARLLRGEGAEALAEREALLDCLEGAAQSVVELLESLLDLSLLESGGLKLDKEGIDAVALARDMVMLYSGEAARKDIALQAVTAEQPVTVYADRLQLRRVLGNLLSNALKFTQTGGAVTVHTVRDARRGYWLVEDTGPGIPAEMATRIFLEGGPRPNQPTAGEASSGLGLAICKRIVTAHGGEVDFVNMPEGGVRFRVALPLDGAGG